LTLQIIADHCPSLRSLSIAGNMQAMDLDVADVCKKATVHTHTHRDTHKHIHTYRSRLGFFSSLPPSRSPSLALSLALSLHDKHYSHFIYEGERTKP
jgi:hypothetical protein